METLAAGVYAGLKPMLAVDSVEPADTHDSVAAMMRFAWDCSIGAGNVCNANGAMPTNEETITERIKNIGSNFPPLGVIRYAYWNRNTIRSSVA
jgi:hypothetical protein